MAKKLVTGTSRLAEWARDKKMSSSEFSVMVGKSHSMSLLYLKEPTEPNFTVPPTEIMELIYKKSDGLLDPSIFYPTDHWDQEMKNGNV